jgi:hypothetical protein
MGSASSNEKKKNRDTSPPPEGSEEAVVVTTNIPFEFNCYRIRECISFYSVKIAVSSRAISAISPIY